MSGADRLAGVLLDAWRAYGGDAVVVFSDVTVEAEALGAEVAWPPGEPPRVVGRPGLDAIRELDPESDGRLPVVLGATERIVAEVAGRVPVLVSLKGPFSLTALVSGMESLLAAGSHAVETATASQARYLRAIVKAGGVPLIGDPFATGSLLGPVHFRRLALPGLARLVEEAHRLGAPAALHVCGDTSPILEPLLESGADLYHLESADIARVTGSGAAVMGGVPTEVFFEEETAVRRAVRQALDAIPDRDRFVLATSCDVPTNADPSLVAAMVDEARRAA
jgi:uroporphyrinogen decarboxylase